MVQLVERGRKLRRLDSGAAIRCFEEAIHEAEASGDRLALVLALAELALELTETAQLQHKERAKSLLLRAVVLHGGSFERNELSAFLLYCRGIFYFQHRNFSDSLIHLRSAYRHYERDPDGLCLVDDALGRYYAALSDFQAAMFHFERSLALRQKMTALHDCAISYGYLGRLYMQMYIHDKAEIYFQQSLDLARQHENTYLELEALAGLGQVAIARQKWQEANRLFTQALLLVREPADSSRTAYLLLDLAEAYLGESRYDEAHECVAKEAISRFEALKSQAGWAAARRIMGRILTYRLKDGLDEFQIEAIETVEDCFLDASIFYEHQGMVHEYAKTLYDMAFLYRVCTNSRYKYQYRGKAIRCLELALSVLEKMNYGATNLIFQIEILLNQIDQTSWLERAVNRLRGRKTLVEAGAIGGHREEATLLSVRLVSYPTLADRREPSEVLQLLNMYLRSATEILQKYQGSICHHSGSTFTAFFRAAITQPVEKDLSTLATDLKTPVAERVRVHPVLRAALAAQEMMAALNTFNQELEQREIATQTMSIGINTGDIILGNIGSFARTEISALGTAVDLAETLCELSQPSEIRLGSRTYTYLKRLVSHRSIAVTPVTESLKHVGEITSYILDELSYSSEALHKPSWLVNLEFPAIVRLEFPLHPDIETIGLVATSAVAVRLGLEAHHCEAIVNAVVELYKEILSVAPSHPDMTVIFVPEETRLEICVDLESVGENNLQNIKIALERMQSEAPKVAESELGGCHIETTTRSLVVRAVRMY